MNNILHRRYRLPLLLILITGIWLTYNALNGRPLSADEAQYWLWSRHLSWGYHSKPPLIALVIRLTTDLFGNSPAAIRASVPLCYLGASLLIYHSARILYNHATGWWSALTFMLLPSICLSASLITTDPFMLLFWCLALLGLVNAINTDQLRHWLLMGVGIGLSAMSKYTGLVFIPSILLYFVATAHHRDRLASWKLYAALAIAMLILSPNLIWNMQHGLPTIKHIAFHNAGVDHWQFHPSGIITFFVQQWAAFSIILWTAFVWIVCTWHKQTHTDQDRLLLWLALPILVLILVDALFSKIDVNWTAPAYVSACILTVHTLLKMDKKQWLRLNCILSIVVITCFYVAELSLQFVNNNPLIKVAAYRKLHHWSVVLPRLQQITNQHKNAHYLFINRSVLAMTAYYGNLPLPRIYYWKADTDYSIETITHLSSAIGKDFILVTRSHTIPHAIQPYFSRAQRIASLTDNTNPHHPFNLYVFRLTRLKTLPFRISP